MTPEEKALALRKRQLKARLAAAQGGSGQSPAMSSGLANLSAMTRSPDVRSDFIQNEDGLVTAARIDPLAKTVEPAEYQNSILGTGAQFAVGTQSGIANTLGFP
ncbi:MAG: hypothetical protein ACRC6I_13975, partial [Paracoccaceae bacterium]